MATRSRQKPGRKAPVSGAGKRVLRRVGANAKKGWNRTLRRHPLVGVLASIALGIAAVVMLLLGVILESFLYYLVSALAGLGTLAIRRAQQIQRERAARPPRPVPGSGPRPSSPPPNSGPKPAPAGSSVKCTETGKPIDVCSLHSRHVATSEGVETFGRPLGSPIGRRRKRDKPGSTP